MSETTPTGLNDNMAGALAYLTPIPAIIFLIVEPYNKNSFIRFHAWQSILLAVGAFIINIILSIGLAFAFAFLPFAHLAAWPLIQLIWFLVWLVCVFQAYSGKKFSLPIIGAIAEGQANK